MISGLAGAAKSLGLRFSFTGVLPLFLLGIYVGFLIIVITMPPDQSVWDGISRAIATGTAPGWFALVVGSLVVALVAEPFQIAIVRLLEGYWGANRVGSHLRAIGAELQRRKAERLKDQLGEAFDNGDLDRATAIQGRLDLFPRERELYLPTQLGNALRTTEVSAGERYGLSTLASWPRILGLVGPDLREAVRELHGQIDGGARLAVVFAASAVASGPVLLARGWWNLLTLASLTLSLIAYKGAVNSAARLRTIIETIYDLHRFDLLRALHLPLPRRADDERESNAQLSGFLKQDWQVDSPLLAGRKYEHPA